MEFKRCIKCGRLLPIYEYYSCMEMKDKHIGKCKDCCRAASRERYARLSQDENWMEAERVRGREKNKRLGHKGFVTSTICPEEKNIARKLRAKGYDTKGKEAHHWNYNEPNQVFLLSRRAHRKIHRHTFVNRDNKYCYTSSGKKIESVEEAKLVYTRIFQKYGINENLMLIDLGHGTL